MSSTRWNLFETNGQTTTEITNERSWTSIGLDGRTLRHRSKHITITSPTWQIKGTINYRTLLGEPLRTGSFQSNFEHLGVDRFIRLHLYQPRVGGRNCIGRIRTYRGSMRGNQWNYEFICVEQTILREEEIYQRPLPLHPLPRPPVVEPVVAPTQEFDQPSTSDFRPEPVVPRVESSEPTICGVEPGVSQEQLRKEEEDNKWREDYDHLLEEKIVRGVREFGNMRDYLGWPDEAYDSGLNSP